MPTDDQFYKAAVLEAYPSQGGTLTRVRVLDGDERNGQELIQSASGSIFGIGGERQARVGQTVIVDKSLDDVGKASWSIVDQYRLTSLWALLALFLALVILVARKRGIGAIFGLMVTVGVLMGFALPQIMGGASPLPVLVLSSVAIASTSLYLAHGLNRRTHVAAAATLLTLGVSVAVAAAMAAFARVYGLGDESSAYLQQTIFGAIDLKGLFLGGIIVGAVGVLDDVTTGQASVVDELAKADPSLGFLELFRRGMSVGTEHIASLVNTLFLAYAGISLPLFLLYQANATQPFWLFMNSEFVAQEAVRTLSGSVTLILAVPLTTALAAWFLRRKGAALDNATKLQ